MCLALPSTAPSFEFQVTAVSGNEGQTVMVCVIVNPFSASGTTQIVTIVLDTNGVSAGAYFE